MAEPELGKLHYEDPRNVWSNEAADFTPWLADNIDLLGEALGLDIEIAQTEAAVGAFSLDILGKVSGSDHIVIIENQLDRTDHSHLGQLLAYAAGLDAAIVIWISSEVRAEHRRTIQWLNEHTVDGIAFFAVELDVLRISGSLPAPRFNVVAEPSEVQIEVVLTTSDTLEDEDGDTYQEFFASLLRQLRLTHPGFTTRDPDRVRNTSSTRFGAGRSGFQFEAAFDWPYDGDDEDDDREERFEVRLTINARTANAPDLAKNEAAFVALHDQREAIERELGVELEWVLSPEYGNTHVGAIRDGSIESSDGDLEDLKTWAVDLLPRFRDAFEPRIAALDLDALTAEAATNEEAAP